MINQKKVNEIKKFSFFILPVLILYTVFFVFPFFRGILYSFTDWGGLTRSYNFIGLDNYRDIFTDDPFFWRSMRNTFQFAFFNIILTNIIAMLFALILTMKFRLNSIMRTIIFLPNMISMVIVGFIWTFIFSKVAPHAYESTSFFLFDLGFLTDPGIVIYSVVIVSLWHGIGYIMTIYIAGIEGIDTDITEAATMDGARGIKMFWYIKLPMMIWVASVGLFINIAGSLKIFDIVISLTAGGPGRSSEVAMLNIYREAFVSNNLAYGTAKAVILSALIIIIAIIQSRYTAYRGGE